MTMKWVANRDRSRTSAGHEYPTTVPEPSLRLWSDEMAQELNLRMGDGDVLGGNRITVGMDPYAQRYGGHQF